MTTPKPSVRILSETPVLTYPRPDHPVVSVAISYQVDAGPPRTIWVDQDRLPDLVWRSTHPKGPEPGKDLLRQGDEARRAEIKADLDLRSRQPQSRTLDL